MTDTSSLRAFIEARLAEDEEMARGAAAPWPAGGGVWTYVETRGGDFKVVNGGGYSISGHYDVDSGPWFTGPHVARHDPARELREVAAKRAILAAAEDADAIDAQIYCEFGTGHRDEATDPYLGDVILLALASVWSDHPDYRTSWAPETVIPGS